ncbi:MAG: dihydrofolate reductase family protein [Acidimicrobiia bacterium]|nr:dihydrofolate reductase family protein [Acidimicrobiia bacterium]
MLRLLPLDPSMPARELAADPAVIDGFIADEPRPQPAGRPWVAVNMVVTADGATHVDGVSGPIGGGADLAVFVALRAAADVILAGSATVTAERYRPPMGNAARRQRRTDRGQAPLPRLAVISNRGDVDLSLPMFSDASDENRPIVVVADGLDPARRRAIEQVAEVLVAGDERVDMTRAIAALGTTAGASFVLAEGGATLNGLLVEADLVDEWCITVAPLLAGGDARRAAIGPPSDLRPMRLDRILEADGELILRYVRSDPR